MIASQYYARPAYETTSDIYPIGLGRWTIYLYGRESRLCSLSLPYAELLKFTGRVQRGPDQADCLDVLYEFQSRPLYRNPQGCFPWGPVAVTRTCRQLHAMIEELQPAMSLIEQSLAAGYCFRADGQARAIFEAARKTFREIQAAINSH